MPQEPSSIKQPNNCWDIFGPSRAWPCKPSEDQLQLHSNFSRPKAMADDAAISGNANSVASASRSKHHDSFRHARRPIFRWRGALAAFFRHDYLSCNTDADRIRHLRTGMPPIRSSQLLWQEWQPRLPVWSSVQPLN